MSLTRVTFSVTFYDTAEEGRELSLILMVCCWEVKGSVPRPEYWVITFHA